MGRNGEQRVPRGRGARGRRRAVAGGVAVAATSLVGGRGAPAHAGTVAPSVQAVCTVIDGTLQSAAGSSTSRPTRSSCPSS
jgi:hypothetical protein